MKISSGNRGESIRSDCYVEVSDRSSITQIKLQSKVKSLFGKSIEALAREMIAFYDVSGATIFIDDAGALPFVISARLEAALRKFSGNKQPFPLQMLPQNNYSVHREKIRRSRLYIPGNNPKMMINAGIYGADAIILDLEDSVAPGKKEEARILVRNALCRVDFRQTERMVRINQLPAGLTDLEFVIPYNVHTVLIPKCESAEQVQQVAEKIYEISGKRRGFFLMPIIESALGVENAFQIASASPDNVALTIGLEDYTSDIGAQRTTEGTESFFARSRVVNAARAAGIQPIDSVFSDFSNPEKIFGIARQSKALGFAGMGCIHPVQVEWVNQGFSPTASEIEKAQKIVLAFEKAQAKGKAAVALGSKMIDPPVVKRALHSVEEAIHFGLINKNWRENHEN